MKNSLKILFVCLFLVSCQQKITTEDIQKLNGYWEIEKVTFDEGEDKEYKMNENFDYFKIANNEGIRRKVRPQFNGTFLFNEDYENVKVRFDKDHVYLDYSTPYAKWTEELLKLTDESMLIKNDQNKEYEYKKAGPINLSGEDEAAQKTK
ncbi:hypothetical protein B6A10_14710 [Flavobacterium sp. L1I52]|uniref:Lipocalin-like domain-containing protein n=1 Tax=Flavobacterium pokkalii TaxID=1940408 RepID=A0ABR7UXC4_9FLAO|nr:hypothetical protein [Flavobacterium pokkalii]MBD0726428.1 hypothetical protein [Flavobacterium pokkalii]